MWTNKKALYWNLDQFLASWNSEIVTYKKDTSLGGFFIWNPNSHFLNNLTSFMLENKTEGTSLIDCKLKNWQFNDLPI